MKKYLILTFMPLILCGCVIYIGCSSVKDVGHWVKLRDHDTIDCYFRNGDSIYCGFTLDAMKGVDVNTFEVCDDKNRTSMFDSYARDKDNVYFPIYVICVESSDIRVGCYAEEYKMDYVFRNRFKYLGDGYATDCSTLYYRGQEVAWQDSILHRNERKK